MWLSYYCWAFKRRILFGSSNESNCVWFYLRFAMVLYITWKPWKRKKRNKINIYVFQVKICMRDMYVWYGCCWLWHSHQMHVRVCRLADRLASERTRYIYRYIVRCKTATMYYHRVNQLNADSGIFLCFVILMLVPLHTASNFDPRQF